MCSSDLISGQWPKQATLIHLRVCQVKVKGPASEFSRLMSKRQAGEKERGARQSHRRLLYCVNVNYTSLDHLLLGMVAYFDEMSHGSSIQRDERKKKSAH